MRFSVFLLFFFLSLSQINAQEIYSFGVVTYNAPLSTLQKREKFIRYLEDSTGYSFSMIIIRNDEELLAAYKSNRIDIAWIGALQYMQYRYELYSYPVAKPVCYDRAFYRGAIITRTDSEIQSIQDLKGKSIAFVSKDSEAGYIFPALLLADKGLYPGNGYYARFLRGHDNVVYNILQKKYDAGAVFDSAINVYLSQTQQESIKVVAYTKDVPYDPVIVSKRLPAQTGITIREALIKLNDSIILKDFNMKGFISAAEKDYSIYSPALLRMIKEQSFKASGEN